MGAAEGFTFQNMVASNLGGLVDPTSSHFLYSVLTAIDAFNIWTLVLTGIGYSCVTKVKRGTCMASRFWLVGGRNPDWGGNWVAVRLDGRPTLCSSPVLFWDIRPALEMDAAVRLPQTDIHFARCVVLWCLPPICGGCGAFSYLKSAPVIGWTRPHRVLLAGSCRRLICLFIFFRRSLETDCRCQDRPRGGVCWTW